MKKADNQLEDLKKQVEDWKAKYLRALADYQNLERRVYQDREESKERSIGEIMHSVLLFRDEILRANKFLNNEGLKHAIDGFEATLRYYNIKEIEVVGKEFNPHEMECVEVVQGPQDNIVVEVLRPGFFIGSKILRVAQVKVSKRKSSVTNIAPPADESNEN